MYHNATLIGYCIAFLIILGTAKSAVPYIMLSHIGVRIRFITTVEVKAASATLLRVTCFFYRNTPYIKPLNAALILKPGKKNPFGLTKNATISAPAPTTAAVTGP